MRISKLLTAVCAAAFLTGSVAVRAQDTPAQAAARAALMQKMNELDAQQSQPTNSNPLASVVIAPSVAPTAPPPVVTPPSVALPTETQTTPAVIVVPEATPPPPAMVTPEVAPVVTPPPAIVVTPSGVMPPPVVPADNSGFFTPVPPPSHPEGAQVAPQQQMPNPNSQPTFEPNPPSKLVKPLKSDKPSTSHVLKAPAPAKPVKPKSAPVVKTPPSANANYAGKTLGLPPYVPPPPPVSAKKEAELQALLAKYMADQMTPDQYQTARAAILAEP